MLDNYKGQREYYRFGDLHSYEQNPLCIRTCVAKNTQATQIYLGNRSYGIQSRGRIEEAKSRTQRYPPIQRPIEAVEINECVGMKLRGEVWRLSRARESVPILLISEETRG